MKITNNLKKLHNYKLNKYYKLIHYIRKKIFFFNHSILLKKIINEFFNYYSNFIIIGKNF